MISSLAFPFVLAAVPRGHWGLNPQLPACIMISTVQNLGSYFVPLCYFPAMIFFFPFSHTHFGSTFLRSNSKPSTQSKQREDALRAKESRSVLTWWWGWRCMLVPAAALTQWLLCNWSPGICIQRRSVHDGYANQQVQPLRVEGFMCGLQEIME